MERRLLAYNFERAVRHQTVIVVEGPTDVWSVGLQSMALMGKTMHPDLQSRFLDALGDDQTVVVMLDPRQDPDEKRKKKPHHIERLVASLRGRLGPRVFGIYLPEELDPGSMERPAIRKIIAAEAKKRNLPVSFGKLRKKVRK